MFGKREFTPLKEAFLRQIQTEGPDYFVGNFWRFEPQA